MSDKEQLKRDLDLFEKQLKDRLGSLPESQQHYDREGKAISLGDWALKFEDRDYCRIKLTHTNEGITVSTVWLGLAHGMLPNGPAIFETMLFSSDGDEMEMYRYATEDEALRNHDYQVDFYGGISRKGRDMIRHRDRMRAVLEEEND